MKAMLVRNFVVVGTSSLDGRIVLTIQRTDTISAHGEGRQQQHRMIVDASGSGGAVYYLLPERGVVTRLTTNQDLHFAVQVSGRTHQFRESAKEEFSLAR